MVFFFCGGLVRAVRVLVVVLAFPHFWCQAVR